MKVVKVSQDNLPTMARALVKAAGVSEGVATQAKFRWAVRSTIVGGKNANKATARKG
jgi:hypothetical protein